MSKFTGNFLASHLKWHMTLTFELMNQYLLCNSFRLPLKHTLESGTMKQQINWNSLEIICRYYTWSIFVSKFCSFYFFLKIKCIWHLNSQILLPVKLLEQNLPMDSAYKSKDVKAAPIRVIQLLYNAGVSRRNIWILSEFLSVSLSLAVIV